MNGHTMTADEYFAIALPTPEDFAAWTRQIHAWADDLNARLERKWPHLFGAKKGKSDGGCMPLFGKSDNQKRVKARKGESK